MSIAERIRLIIEGFCVGFLARCRRSQMSFYHEGQCRVLVTRDKETSDEVEQWWEDNKGETWRPGESQEGGEGQ